MTWRTVTLNAYTFAVSRERRGRVYSYVSRPVFAPEGRIDTARAILEDVAGAKWTDDRRLSLVLVMAVPAGTVQEFCTPLQKSSHHSGPKVKFTRDECRQLSLGDEL